MRYAEAQDTSYHAASAFRTSKFGATLQLEKEEIAFNTINVYQRTEADGLVTV
jgi:hypothetical protein